MEYIEPMKCYTFDLPQISASIKQTIKSSIKKESGYVVMTLVTADIDTGLASLDKAGYQILNILYSVGFWVITIKCIYDIIQHALHGDRRAVGNTVITYVIIYGSLYFVPWALRLVKGVF